MRRTIVTISFRFEFVFIDISRVSHIYSSSSSARRRERRPIERSRGKNADSSLPDAMRRASNPYPRRVDVLNETARA